VAEGQQLKFSNVSSARFVDTIPAAILATPGTYTVSASYAALSTEPRLLAIDSVVADSGNLTLTTQNRLTVPLSYTITLNGFRNSAGATLTANRSVPAAPVNSYKADTLVFNLAGVTIKPPTVTAALSFTFTVPPGGVNPAVADSAIIQTGLGRIVARTIYGKLDPTKTPELKVAVEQYQAVDSSQFNFGDLKDAVQQARVNDARIVLTIRNTANAPLTLTTFTLGVVKLTAGLLIPKDGSGNIMYQQDSLGPITVPVVDPGQSTLTIPRQAAAKADTLQASRMLNRLVDSALAGKAMALVGAGTAAVGDGAAGVIRYLDSVIVRMGNTVGLDFTVPPAGVTFNRIRLNDGADLKDQDANQIATKVDSASATAIVSNGTPFGVRVRIALVPDSQPPNVTADSIFLMTNRVELGPVSVRAGSVNAQGQVTAPVFDTATVSMSGAQSRVLLGKKFTAAIKATLLPSGSNTRGAIRPTDKVIIRARGAVRLKLGGTP
jgi:hypothetical protein